MKRIIFETRRRVVSTTKIARFNNNARHPSPERKRSVFFFFFFFALSIVELYILHIFLAAGVTSIFFHFCHSFCQLNTASIHIAAVVICAQTVIHDKNHPLDTLISSLLQKTPSFSSLPPFLSFSLSLSHRKKKTYTHVSDPLSRVGASIFFSYTLSKLPPTIEKLASSSLSLFSFFFFLFFLLRFIFKYPRRFPLNLILRFSTLHRMLPSRVNFNITFSWKQTGPIYP